MGCSLCCSRFQRQHSPVTWRGVCAGLLQVTLTVLFCVPEWGVHQFAPGCPGSIVLGPGWSGCWFTLGCKGSTFLCPSVKHMLGCSRSHLQHCPGAQYGAGTRFLWVTKSEVSCGLVWGVCWAALGQTAAVLGHWEVPGSP